MVNIVINNIYILTFVCLTRWRLQ